MANYSFLFDNEEKFEDNLKVASEWKERILRQADIAGQEIFEQEGVGEGGGRSMGCKFGLGRSCILWYVSSFCVVNYYFAFFFCLW